MRESESPYSQLLFFPIVRSSAFCAGDSAVIYIYYRIGVTALRVTGLDGWSGTKINKCKTPLFRAAVKKYASAALSRSLFK